MIICPGGSARFLPRRAALPCRDKIDSRQQPPSYLWHTSKMTTPSTPIVAKPIDLLFCGRCGCPSPSLIHFRPHISATGGRLWSVAEYGSIFDGNQLSIEPGAGEHQQLAICDACASQAIVFGSACDHGEWRPPSRKK